MEALENLEGDIRNRQETLLRSLTKPLSSTTYLRSLRKHIDTVHLIVASTNTTTAKMTTFAGTNHSNETLIPSHTSTSENHCISSSRRALSYLKSSFRADESTTDPSFVAHRDHRAANPHTTFVTASDPTFYTPSNSTNTNPSRCNDFIETRTDPSFTALKMGRRTGGNAYVETHTDPSFTALQMELRKGGSVETRSDPTFAMARAHREAHPNRRVESRTDPSFTMVQGGRGFNC